MIREALSHFTMVWLPITGQLLFLFAFIATLAWTLRKGGKKIYNKISQIPLDGE